MKIPNHKKNDRLAFFTWTRERYAFWRRIAHLEQHHHTHPAKPVPLPLYQP